MWTACAVSTASITRIRSTGVCRWMVSTFSNWFFVDTAMTRAPESLRMNEVCSGVCVE